MNTLEAIFSFLVLVSLMPLFLLFPQSPVDTSHYQLKLVEDIWRVLYLKGDFEYFNKDALNEDLEEIHELTSLCVSFEEEEVASCLPNEASVVVEKVAFINGNPKIITISIGVE